MLTARQAEILKVLKETVPGFTTMRSLAMRFRGLLRGKDVGKLYGWINDARNCDIPSIIHFARTLMHDIDAVRNAVIKPWSNGPTEGHQQAQDPEALNVRPCRHSAAESSPGAMSRDIASPKVRMNHPSDSATYKDLARVEQAFRTMKSIDLQIRPAHHCIEPRVRAHVFLCMLGYYVEWHLREAWAPILFHDHDRAAAQQARISPVAAAKISDAAKRERSIRRTDDGLPVSSFRDLIDHLATMTLNLVASPHAPNATITLTAKPTPLQATAPFRYVSSRPPSRFRKDANSNRSFLVPIQQTLD